MITASIVLVLHAATTLAMTGLIWFVQVVHYPLFARVGRAGFDVYEHEHQQRTARVVAPLMLLELATAIWIALYAQIEVRALASLGLVALLIIWLSTAAIQVPLHRTLSSGFDSGSIARLVRSNWLRTVLWSLRSLIALALLVAS